MRAGSIQRDTLVISLLFAGAAVVVANLFGQLTLGVGIGVGLILGSLNGYLIQAMLNRGAPMLATSFLRLVLFSLLALAAARLLGSTAWPVVMGVAAAQIVMVGVGVRQGGRA